MSIAHLGLASLALCLPAAAQTDFGWHYAVHAEDTPPDEDDDSVSWYEPGSGSAFARAFKDLKLEADATGTYVTYSDIIGAVIQAHFETDVEVAASWSATTSAYYIPNPDVPGDQGWASAEAEAKLEGVLHCDDYPASFGLTALARITSTVLQKAVVVSENDAGTFTKSNMWTLGIGGSSSGASGTLSFTGAAGSFGGGWVPVEIYYGPKYESDVGEDCSNTYEHDYEVAVKGKAAAGKGYLLPGIIDFSLDGYALCTEAFDKCGG
jgi:hypothetical protein